MKCLNEVEAGNDQILDHRIHTASATKFLIIHIFKFDKGIQKLSTWNRDVHNLIANSCKLSCDAPFCDLEPKDKTRHFILRLYWNIFNFKPNNLIKWCRKIYSQLPCGPNKPNTCNRVINFMLLKKHQICNFKPKD